MTLSERCAGDLAQVGGDLGERLLRGIAGATYTAKQLLSDYCTMLYRQFGTYEEVARRTELDRRTVKKHVLNDGEQ